jgi:hypothetical protein
MKVNINALNSCIKSFQLSQVQNRPGKRDYITRLSRKRELTSNNYLILACLKIGLTLIKS